MVYMVITSKSVFQGVSGISALPNFIHPVYNTAGYNTADDIASMPTTHICAWPNCVMDIKFWMTATLLQLNMDKTEVLMLMIKSPRNPNTMSKIKISSIDIFIKCIQWKKS